MAAAKGARRVPVALPNAWFAVPNKDGNQQGADAETIDTKEEGARWLIRMTSR
jgi:hypothetical protein